MMDLRIKYLRLGCWSMRSRSWRKSLYLTPPAPLIRGDVSGTPLIKGGNFCPLYQRGNLHLIKKDLHPIEARLVERFKDIQGSKEERTGTASRVKDCYLSDGFPEGAEEFGALAIFNNLLGELADVEIVGNQIVDVVYFAVRKFGLEGFYNADAVRRSLAKFLSVRRTLQR